MLHELLHANRTPLIDRCRVMVASRSEPKASHSERAHGIPIFLDQIIKLLTTEQCPDLAAGRLVSNAPARGSNPDICQMATQHGRDLFLEGFTIEQVIRDYGDVCQAVTNLAVETGSFISAGEFRTFNRCLDDAIAAAVTEYSRQDSQMALAQTQEALSAAQLTLFESNARNDDENPNPLGFVDGWCGRCGGGYRGPTHECWRLSSGRLCGRFGGKAPTKDASDLAEMIAKDTDGVTAVHNKIVVRQ